MRVPPPEMLVPPIVSLVGLLGFAIAAWLGFVLLCTLIVVPRLLRLPIIVITSIGVGVHAIIAVMGLAFGILMHGTLHEPATKSWIVSGYLMAYLVPTVGTPAVAWKRGERLDSSRRIMATSLVFVVLFMAVVLPLTESFRNCVVGVTLILKSPPC